MKEKFNFAKFILDCFICLGLMIVSSIVFFMPILYLTQMIEYSLNLFIDSSKFFRNFSFTIIFVPPSLILPLVCYSKFYKFYKTSLIFCFLILVIFVVFVDYTLSYNFRK